MLTTRAKLRQLLLARQGLSGGRSQAGIAGALAWIQHQGFLQLATKAQALAPGHDLILFNRLAGYEAGHLELLLYDNKHFFEHYLHILGALPVKDFALIHDPERIQQASRPGSIGARVLDLLRTGGPATARELTAGCNGDGANRRAVEGAIQELYASGAILVQRYEGRQRVYELASRILPQTALKTLPLEERLRKLVHRSLQFLAPVTLATWKQVLNSIGSRSKLGVTAMKREKTRLIDEMLASGQAIRVEVSDPPEWYIVPAEWLQSPAGESQTTTPRVSFLSSLDPIVWDRQRAIDLFNFDFRQRGLAFGIQRRPLAAILSILYGDALIGQVDCQMSWTTERLFVRSIQLDNQSLLNDRFFQAAFGSAMSALATFHGARDIRAAASLPPRLLP